MAMFTHRNVLLDMSLIMLNNPFAEQPTLCVVESIVLISQNTVHQQDLKDPHERYRHRVPTLSISRSSNPLSSIIVSFNPSPLPKIPHNADSTITLSNITSSSPSPTFSLVNELNDSTNNTILYYSSQNVSYSHIPSMLPSSLVIESTSTNYPSSLNTFNSSEPQQKDGQAGHNNGTNNSNKNETKKVQIIRPIGITLFLLTISFFSFLCFKQNYCNNHNSTRDAVAPHESVGLSSVNSVEELLADSNELVFYNSIDHTGGTEVR